jgi:hypothetical protein
MHSLSRPRTEMILVGVDATMIFYRFYTLGAKSSDSSILEHFRVRCGVKNNCLCSAEHSIINANAAASLQQSLLQLTTKR